MAVVGCIADDFTGATDLAGGLVRGGLRVLQYLELPLQLPGDADCDALVIALKTRSATKDEAVEQSLAAVKALQKAGCRRFLFKYCSTFDSTPSGNIGPVAEALLSALDCEQTILCPAFPGNGRTQYLGHLFVHGSLLSESGMRDHPLTPMRDSNLVRVLSAQATLGIGLVGFPVVDSGVPAVTQHLAEFLNSGKQLVLTDALSDRHLETLAEACQLMPLVTGGSAIGAAMVHAWRRIGVLPQTGHAAHFPTRSGDTLILAGSCSPATQRQVQEYARQHPTMKLDVLESVSLESVVAWAVEHRHQSPLIYTTTDSERLKIAQDRLGSRPAAARAEEMLAELAVQLADCVFPQLIVAGGETAGTILRRLGVRALRIGPEICLGVPWTESLGDRVLKLALKSGNFGAASFFHDAQCCLRDLPD